MTILSVYQRNAAKFINPELSNEEMKNHAVFGLCSEAGEVASLFQKVYQGHEMDKDHLIKELGDVLWFIAEVCTANDIDMSDVAKTNIEKLSSRYPNGFEVAKSLNRKEGDI